MTSFREKVYSMFVPKDGGNCSESKLLSYNSMCLSMSLFSRRQVSEITSTIVSFLSKN